MTWEGLSPPYATIVADPPWHYEQGGPTTGWGRLRGGVVKRERVGAEVLDPDYGRVEGWESVRLDTLDAVIEALADIGEHASRIGQEVVERWGLPVYDHTRRCRVRGCFSGWPDECRFVSGAGSRR